MAEKIGQRSQDPNKKNDNLKNRSMNALIKYIKRLFSGANSMTILSGFFILQTLVYNFMYDGQAWLKDFWFVQNYMVIAALWWNFKGINWLVNASFLVALVKLAYNAGIMFKWCPYDLDNSNYYVLAIVVLILLITEENKLSRWLKLRFLSLLGFAKKSYFLRRFFYK